MEERKISAYVQNKVFVEKAHHKPLSPREAERQYGLDRGKGIAYIEFDVAPSELMYQDNPKIPAGGEYYLKGDVDLTKRNPNCFER